MALPSSSPAVAGTQGVLPEGVSCGQEVARNGIRPVSTLSLRRALAADWVRWALEEKGQSPAGAWAAHTATREIGRAS